MDDPQRLNQLKTLERLAPRHGDPWQLHFPTFFELDLDADAERRLKVCIATRDIVGPTRNGGIGTAYYYVALSLARAGHEVTVLYAPDDNVVEKNMEYWVGWYREKGIDLVLLPDPEVPLPSGPVGRRVALAYAIDQWLRGRHFDIVHVSEWKGIGYYAILAKHLGVAFAETRFIVKTSSPSVWNKLGNSQPISGIDELMVSYMERRSVELADVVVSGSQYMLRWMASEGYLLPEGRCFNQPNLVPAEAFVMPAGEPQRSSISEIVFFGRLEPRKGLYQFADAIPRLEALLDKAGVAKRPKIVFLGKQRHGFDAVGWLAETAGDWPFDYEVVDTLNQPEALAFLKEPGRLAVIPSLVDNSPFGIYECLYEQIPFVASDVGGIPELIDRRDHPQVLFDPHPQRIAERLFDAFVNGGISARPSYDFNENDRRWEEFHQALATGAVAPPHPVPALPTEWPPVTVCITTYNRPHEVRQAIASVGAQDYPALEVVLVDDGSDDPAMIAQLRRLEAEFGPRGWKVVRQENLYLGAARNTGVRHATGKYVYFLDDDNLLKPGALRRLVALAEHHGIDYTSSFSDVFVGAEPPDDGSRPVQRVALLGGASLGPGLFYNVFGDANALIRVSALEAVGGFTEDYGVGKDDQELAARLVLNGHSVVHIPLPLYWMRHSKQRLRDRHYSWQAGDFRVMRPYLQSLPAAIHPLLLLAYSSTIEAENLRDRQDRLKALRKRNRELEEANAKLKRKLAADRKERVKRLFGWVFAPVSRAVPADEASAEKLQRDSD